MAGHTTDDGTTFAGSNTSVVNATTLYTGITSSRYFNLVSDILDIPFILPNLAPAPGFEAGV
jgi:hypothetical protein